MKKIILLVLVSVLLLMITIAYASNVLAWSNGGYSDDPSNPDYGTHDWIAEHALGWLPEREKRYIVDNLAAYLYGTELPDNGMAPDGIGDTTKHHVYYWSNGSLQDAASAVRAYEEYNNTLNFLNLGDLTNAAKTAGIMSHYIVDVAVFGHVMGATTDWGAEEHHSDYETYVNQRTSSYGAEFNVYLSFDGELNLISAYEAAKELAYDTTFDVDGDLTCVWMDQNYNWSDPVFKSRCGESLNLAVNYLTDVLHTLYSEAVSVHNIDTGLDYLTIQGAINASETLNGHTILVDAGTYFEHVTITKSISLIGEDRDATFVDGNGTGTVIRIGANDVSVTDLTISNAGRIWGPPPGYGYPDSCVLGRNVRRIRIENNTFTAAAVCSTFTDYSSSVNISNNIIFDATYIGILGYASYNITIYHNFVSDYGSEGIHLDGGSSYCKVLNNTVKNGFDGISLEKSTTANNLIDGNRLLNNTLTNIGLWKCGTNVFRRNNMTGKQHNLLIWGYSLTSFMQDIDDSNIANNKILYYLTNRHNLLIDHSNYLNLGYIAIVNCTNIIIRDFDLASNGDGILLARSTNCTLMNITLSDNRGPLIYGGFPLIYGGLMFFESSNNTIVDNRICNNSYGVCLYYSDWNVFYHNSFTFNDKHIVSDFYSPFLNRSSGYFSINIWDNDYPSGGNYWSNYLGEDLSSGRYQNETGNDGIGDVSYVIDEKNQDKYPVMGIFSDLQATSEYHVQTICNSTISDFQFNGTAICFNVSGQNGTTGFCRICVPTALMNGTYKVFVNGTEVSYTFLSCSNSTHSYLYFTYNHSTQEVIIIPEFPTWAPMLLVLILLTFATVVYKQRLGKKLRLFCCS